MKYKYIGQTTLILPTIIIVEAICTAWAQGGGAVAKANNPLANMTAFNMQNYYIGDLTESD